MYKLLEILRSKLLRNCLLLFIPIFFIISLQIGNTENVYFIIAITLSVVFGLRFCLNKFIEVESEIYEEEQFFFSSLDTTMKSKKK